MKRSLFLKSCNHLLVGLLLLPCFVLIGCSNQEDPLESDTTIDYFENKTVFQKRSFDEALKIAKQSVGAFALSETRANVPQKRISLPDTKYIIKTSTRNVSENDTLMYVFNFENNQGFTVISANKATEPILAQTEMGTYDENIEVENPAFGMYMDIAEQYVLNTITPIDTTVSSLKEFKIVKDTIETMRVAPKIALRWGQTGCEATYTTNGYSGCSNTAMAQIMSYFNYPTNLSITYPNAIISTLSLNWNDIKMHNVSHSKQTCSATNDSHNVIGHLLRQLGHLNLSNYYVDGTSTYIFDVRNSFSSLGYTVSDIINYSGENLYSLLANNNLFYMRGDRIKDNGDLVGHAWVVDGFLQHKITVSEWSRDFGSIMWKLLTTYEPYYVGYYHMNWGWDGNCNGYFLADVFATNQAVEYDNANNNFNNTTNRNYCYNVKYFYVTK